MIDDPLIYVRAVHFAATLTMAGAVFFIVFIAEPAFRQAENSTRVAVFVRLALAWIGWIGLVATAVTGVAWLVLLAESMSASRLREVFSEGILWTVLLETSFGRDWLTRAVLVCLAGMFVPFLSARGVKSVWIKSLTVVLAVGLVGTLAWAGHAVGGSGIEAITHPAADFLHLVAAAAWVGMLLPLALVLAAAGRDPASVTVARTTTVRFSTFGIASVGTLLVTGSINTWYLVGNATALTDTYYGRLLLTKVALFLGMVAIAAVNRLHSTPRLVKVGSGLTAQDALRRLRRNTAIEVVMGIVVICIVAVLGVTPHGSHHHSH